MNILVLGSGGREHAITWALAKSPRTESLCVAPGNGGTEGIALANGGASENVKVDQMDAQAVLDFVKEREIDLVVIGPEAPLVAGVADVLRDAGVLVYGPNAAEAQLEGSKAYAKRFMDRNNIPTAAYADFTEEAPAIAYVEEQGAPIVIKADGLAAGKGVVVAETLEDAKRDHRWSSRNACEAPSARCFRSLRAARVSRWRLHRITNAHTMGIPARTQAVWACILRCRSSRMTR